MRCATTSNNFLLGHPRTYRLFWIGIEEPTPSPRSNALRVLVVHNRYRSELPSGENFIVDTEVESLRARGIDVRTFFRSSDEFQTLGPISSRTSSLSALTGRSSRRDFLAQLSNFNPDVVHLHNPYPLISPNIIDWSHSSNVPVVCTIHNFRLRCMNGLLFRNGEICTECEDRSIPWPGVVHSCYRDARLGSVVMAAALALHKHQWVNVDRFIAVSEFVADRLKSWGFDADRITVKPNPVVDPGTPYPPGDGFLFAGRLSQEKGVRLLLDAWEHSGLGSSTRLIIAGDGPLRDLVNERAKQDHSIDFKGLVDPQVVSILRKQTAVAVFPSLSFETHSAIAESFAYGRPVIATSLGALREVVDSTVGWVCDPTVEGVSNQLVQACNRSEIELRGQRARSRFLDKYQLSTVTDQLIETYESVRHQRDDS